MTELRVSVDVSRPPADVFAALTDWTRQGEWMPGTQVRVTAGSGSAVGDEILARTALRPSGPGRRLGFDDPMRITGWDPPRRCDVLHLGRVVRGHGTFLVVAAAAGSRVTWLEDAQAPLGAPGAALLRLGRPAVQATLRLALRRFSRWTAGAR